MTILVYYVDLPLRASHYLNWVIQSVKSHAKGHWLNKINTTVQQTKVPNERNLYNAYKTLHIIIIGRVEITTFGITTYQCWKEQGAL